MKREIIKIDEEKCTGCGLCIPHCPENAIQIIDNKARLVSDIFCDGLGECLGHCPEGAITIEERAAEPYNEDKVMENIVHHGANTIRAHLKHLNDHGETELYNQAVHYLDKERIELPEEKHTVRSHQRVKLSGCPGSISLSIDRKPDKIFESAECPSYLAHWPVQLHLAMPTAEYYKNADLLLAADCTAFTLGDFHTKWLKGKSIAIACPKLDGGREIYVEKLKTMIDEAKVNTITVLIMQVPCCGGMIQILKKAMSEAIRMVPVKVVIVSIKGEILQEEWIDILNI
ncbi:4Fe-4S binding protein [bacterium]|nr:4Fe-4S binding protein [bacterium]